MNRALYVLLACVTVFVAFVVTWALLQKTVDTWYIPPVYRRNRSARPRRRLRVLTYNIQKFPWSPKSLETLVTLVNDYDVILLQECFSDTWQSLSEVLPQLYCFRGTLNRLNMMNSGLAILSRYPIDSGAFLEFSHANRWTWDIFSEKGWLSAVINVDGTMIRVLNTHLQSCDFDRFDQMALIQFDELCAYLSTVYEPFILGGDFNIDVRDLQANYRGLGGMSYPKDPTIYIHFGTSLTSARPRRGYTGMTLDYFFTSSSLKRVSDPRVVSFLEFSDHQPVEIEMEIVEKQKRDA